MNKEGFIYLVFIVVFVLLGYSFYLTLGLEKLIKQEQIVNLINIVSSDIKIESKYDFTNIQYEKIELNKISITSYNNESNQTDDSPNIMASNRLVYEGAIAISRDLKTKYQLQWGDIIYIETLKRYFVIEDLMGERFKNRLDIFSFDKKWSLNIHLKNQNIIIYKIKR